MPAPLPDPEGRCLAVARVGPSRLCYSSNVAAIRIHTVLSSTTFELPELAPLVGHRVELTIREESERDWPERWFEAIEGAIEDPTFERACSPRRPTTRPINGLRPRHPQR